YVRGDRGIKAAKDLEGCAVGVPEWAQTAGIYARGILAEEFGFDLSKIRWLQAGVNEPGRTEKVALRLPSGMRCEPRPDTSLSAMLASGEIDAVISARAPEAPNSRVVRLFPDYRAEEARFFKKTGILPIRARSGRDPPSNGRGRSVPARGARDGKGLNYSRGELLASYD